MTSWRPRRTGSTSCMGWLARAARGWGRWRSLRQLRCTCSCPETHRIRLGLRDLGRRHLRFDQAEELLGVVTKLFDLATHRDDVGPLVTGDVILLGPASDRQQTAEDQHGMGMALIRRP